MDFINPIPVRLIVLHVLRIHHAHRLIFSVNRGLRAPIPRVSHVHPGHQTQSQVDHAIVAPWVLISHIRVKLPVSPQPCPPDTDCTQSGLSMFTCAPGFTINQNNNPQFSCIPCLLGMYKAVSGNQECMKCPMNTFQPDGEARTSCKDCPKNSLCTNNTLSCQTGYEKSTDGQACVSSSGTSRNWWVTTWQHNPTINMVIILSGWLTFLCIGFIFGFLIRSKINKNLITTSTSTNTQGVTSQTSMQRRPIYTRMSNNSGRHRSNSSNKHQKYPARDARRISSNKGARRKP